VNVKTLSLILKVEKRGGLCYHEQTFEQGKPMPKTATPKNSEAAILSRVIQGSNLRLSPDAARALLNLGFTAEDKRKMHEPAVKNQKGKLSEDEERELDSYLRVGRFLDLLSATAAKSLQSVS
jgi:hypothetical protein